MSVFNGRTALVTGASRGIGRATALALAAAGARVLIHYSSSETQAQALVAQIQAAGGSAEALRADLALPDGPHELARQTRERVDGRLDILVANAGLGIAASLEELKVEDFDRLFAVNVRAPYFLVQQLLPVLREGSSIILVGSLAARRAAGTITAYAATKAAVHNLVIQFASLLGAKGIRVNAVAPGVVATDMTSGLTKSPAGREMTLAVQALKRIAEPDDIAGAIAFLASDAARWVTGEVLQVDGGSKL
jgi:3-oxoacyl-[acyl-carrier protein] reductase